MLTGQDTYIIDALARVISQSRVWALSRLHGFVQRARRIDPYQFVWTLVLGFGTGRERTLAGLRREYELTTGTTVARSSFYDRFNAGLVNVLKALLVDALCELQGRRDDLDGLLTRFRDVVATDAMVIRLKDGLEKFYRACRTNHTKAAAKLHAVISVFPQGPKTVRLSPERLNDRRAFRIGPWVRGRLLLMDLGYFGYRLFDRIHRNGGFFVSRLKVSCNPLIVACHVKWRGQAMPIVGKHLLEVLPLLQREILDLEVEVEFKRGSYRGTRRTAKRTLRLVGLLDEQSGEYHLYLTNIPPEDFTAQEVAQLYAARWCIELWFRELSTRYRVRDLPSENPEVVKSLIYAALISLAIGHRILNLLRLRIGEDGHRVRTERLAAAMEQAGGHLLRLLIAPWPASLAEEEALEHVLLRQILDPNKERPDLLQRVTAGSQLEYMKTVYAPVGT